MHNGNRRRRYNRPQAVLGIHHPWLAAFISLPVAGCTESITSMISMWLLALLACTLPAGVWASRMCIARSSAELDQALSEPECRRLRVERFDLHFTPKLQQLLAEKPIESLALSGTTLFAEDLGFLAAVLEDQDDLASLLLWENKGLEGTALASLVVGVLRASPRLRHLTISGNKLHPEHMAQLADALSQSALTSLVLTDNGITPSGAVMLAGALHDMSLESLEISCKRSV